MVNLLLINVSTQLRFTVIHAKDCGIHGPGRTDWSVHESLLQGGFIERENRNVFEVGFIREYCDGFAYRLGCDFQLGHMGALESSLRKENPFEL